ncbi:hypothetical protein ACIGMX_32930 [Streptomyces aquilus]|uniref:hypothetical protein n=1 Tax=Streptomyces aquilus TaxID=2548456 RepID=UPI0037D915DD
MPVPVLDAVATLAPVDCEFVMTTAEREGVTADTGLSGWLEKSPMAAQIHALTVCMVLMLLEAHGRYGALAFVTASAEDYVRRGFPRLYPST